MRHDLFIDWVRGQHPFKSKLLFWTFWLHATVWLDGLAKSILPKEPVNQCCIFHQHLLAMQISL